MAGEENSSPDDLPTRRHTPDDQATVRGLGVGQRVFGRFVLEAVALKFLPEVVARDAVAIDELKEEARRARRLTHPHIVRIHDFVQDEAQAAVSMEYVAGPPWPGILHEGGRPVLRGNVGRDNKDKGIWWIDDDQPPVIGPGNLSDGKELPLIP